MATTQATIDELNQLFAKMEDLDQRATKAEEALNDLRISNAEKLGKLQLDLINKKAKQELEIQQEVFQKYLEEGGRVDAVLAREKHRNQLRELDEQLKRDLEGKTETEKTALRAAANARRRALEDEFEERLNRETDLREELKKIDEAEAKAKKKREEAEAKEKRKRKAKEKYEDQRQAREDATAALNTASGALGSTFGTIFRKDKIDRAREELELQGIEDPDKYIKGAQINAAFNALAGFAKQLENTATEVAEAQSAIDTRLQGSKNKSSLGSYWREMSNNITENIGISPFLKQADAVNSLKTLVGKGIAFNVEQRAFLDTISEKIANTFEATDATLLKLVRIQQADTTAARLGMESALTAFLNNMYETTEYMTEAADSIRASIYEASALMDAEDATEFEYQVQKWMGSLYSVGFQNTQGLSDALGKLAAGDIGGVTDNGYGNLLVMAVNKANLSIAEILADGLNDDETNALMHAMVMYLGEIYNETKDNKVVAQQFASVYGLTASDLKAAANLASTTTNVVSDISSTTTNAAANLANVTANIYKTNLNYGGMLDQLTQMAKSMPGRTALGTMVNNIIENFKYSTAASIGNDPVLYTMYTVASLLDETVGGIAIPTIGAWAVGNGVEIDLETTVADIMRTGAMAGGLLGGIGKMMVGLAKGSGGGFSGPGMLKAFGINLDSDKATMVERGNGANLLVTASGMDTSYSGYVGNEDGNAVKDKMLTDAKDEANQQAIQALEEAQEISLSNVDEHVVQIYRLLEDLVSGSRNLHVTFGGTEGNSWTNSSGYTPSGVPML